MYLVDRATKRPQRPSQFLGFDRVFDSATCLDFDLTLEEFSYRLDLRRSRKALIDAPKGDGVPKQAVAFYETVDQLLGNEPSPYEDEYQYPSEESFSAEDAEILERFARGEIDDFADLHRESKPWSTTDRFMDE